MSNFVVADNVLDCWNTNVVPPSNIILSKLEELKVVLNKLWALDGPDITYTDSVYNTFKAAGGNLSKTLSLEECVNAVGMITDFTENECKCIFNLFDKNHDGSVDFNEFMSKLHTQMKPKRYNAVKKMFDRVDIDNTGTITVMDFVKNKHNNRGDWFMTHVISDYNVDNKNVITFSEFINYYSDLSLFVDNDDLFIADLEECWKTAEYAPSSTVGCTQYCLHH